MRVYGGSGGTVPLILNLSTRQKKELNGQSASGTGHFTPVEQSTRYQLNWSPGGPQIRTGYSREEKYLSPLLGIELQFIHPTAF